MHRDLRRGEALAGGPRAPELAPAIERVLVTLYGPGWDRLPDWPAVLEASRRRRASFRIADG
jgi:hypothetical protein